MADLHLDKYRHSARGAQRHPPAPAARWRSAAWIRRWLVFISPASARRIRTALTPAGGLAAAPSRLANACPGPGDDRRQAGRGRRWPAGGSARLACRAQVGARISLARLGGWIAGRCAPGIAARRTRRQPPAGSSHGQQGDVLVLLDVSLGASTASQRLARGSSVQASRTGAPSRISLPLQRPGGGCQRDLTAVSGRAGGAAAVRGPDRTGQGGGCRRSAPAFPVLAGGPCSSRAECSVGSAWRHDLDPIAARCGDSTTAAERGFPREGCAPVLLNVARLAGSRKKPAAGAVRSFSQWRAHGPDRRGFCRCGGQLGRRRHGTLLSSAARDEVTLVRHVVVRYGPVVRCRSWTTAFTMRARRSTRRIAPKVVGHAVGGSAVARPAGGCQHDIPPFRETCGRLLRQVLRPAGSSGVSRNCSMDFLRTGRKLRRASAPARRVPLAIDLGP